MKNWYEQFLHWDESNKIPIDYVLTYRLIIKYKLRVKSK